MEIKVFGMDNCAGCVTVKEVLKSKGIPFTERDVMNVDHMGEASELGIRGVPTTVVYSDGVRRLQVTGSTPEAIKKILEVVED